MSHHVMPGRVQDHGCVEHESELPVVDGGFPDLDRFNILNPDTLEVAEFQHSGRVWESVRCDYMCIYS